MPALAGNLKKLVLSITCRKTMQVESCNDLLDRIRELEKNEYVPK
jgi:hypothetical protein